MPVVTALAHRQLQHVAESFHKHAHGCKKPLDTCTQCKQGIEWFGSLPLETLAHILEDKPLLKVQSERRQSAA